MFLFTVQLSPCYSQNINIHSSFLTPCRASLGWTNDVLSFRALSEVSFDAQETSLFYYATRAAKYRGSSRVGTYLTKNYDDMHSVMISGANNFLT